MAERAPRVEPARIEFHDERTPYSPRFEDVYFSPASGSDESRYVYLEGSGFSERIRKPPGDTQGWLPDPIAVGEIGFGVGLNFLLTLQEFASIAPPGAKLHYFSFEKHPVVREDLARLYRAYPEYSKESAELLRQYPVLTPGIHLLKFLGGRVRLYLALGDVHEQLPRSEFQADHWYWDGFAPSRNPDAFSERLFLEIARHSKPGAKGASFTSAGWVRRGLEAAGFAIEKRPGFGKKRECITGALRASIADLETPITHPRAPGFRVPWFSGSGQKPLRAREKVAILGAGLAGSAVAYALADSGAELTVFDPLGIATRASGNPVGLFNVQISKVPNPMSRFSQAALVQLLSELQTFPIEVRGGILRTDLLDPAPLLDSDYPEDFFQVTDRGVLLPMCGMLNPVELCRYRIEASGARFVQDAAPAEEISRFDHVIHATGAMAQIPHPPLLQVLHDSLPTRAIRGQVILVRPTPVSRGLSSVLVQEGYASPLAPSFTGGEELHLIGATYQAKIVAPDQEELDSASLLEEAKKWPEFSGLSREHLHSSRAGYRLSTPDKMPLIGPLCDPEALASIYLPALRGAKTDLSNLPPLPAIPGQWVLTGLGSRGITTSSLCAEILASMMTGAPLPVENDLLEHLHSARFFIRNLRKPAVK